MLSASENNLDNNANEFCGLQEESITCSICAEKLCLREKTINLALGNTD